MVAMKKVEQGRISLDENINNKLTSWKLPDNEFTARKKVTLRNLLSHTAGTTVHGFPGYAVTEKVPTLQQVLDGAAPANTIAVRVDFEPGTQYRYSGGGITIAQLAIMDIEKKPYPEIAKLQEVSGTQPWKFKRRRDAEEAGRKVTIEHRFQRGSLRLPCTCKPISLAGNVPKSSTSQVLPFLSRTRAAGISIP